MVLQMYPVFCRQRPMMKHAAANIFLRSLTMAAGLVASTGALGQGVCPEPACQVRQNISPEVQVKVNTEFLGRYIGTAQNTTEGARGRMSIDIEQSDSNSYKLTMKVWDGLNGKGTFIGKISNEGQLSATGTISEPRLVFRASRAWDCNITGLIRGNKLQGNYSLFPKTVGRQGCAPLYGYPCVETEKSEGRFDLEKFQPLVPQ